MEFKDILELLEDKREQKLWERILRQIPTDKEEITAKLKHVLQQEVNFIRGEVEEPFSPWFIKVNIKDLGDFGRPDDIESPLGFLKVLLPFRQDNPDVLKIYAPCILSALELLYKYGPEVAALYAANVNPDLSLKDLYHEAKKRFDRSKAPFYDKIKSKIVKWKEKYAPFFSVASSQHFYQLGINFYYNRSTKFVGSRSPGIMLPDEYYGEIYYPGITEELTPGSIVHDGLEKYRDFLKCMIKNDQIIENPLRPIYFDDGIRRSKGCVIYSIFQNEMKDSLERTLQIYNEKQDKYISDLISVLWSFMKSEYIIIKLVETPAKDSLHDKYTLISETYFFLSERDQNRKKISRGRIVNIPLFIDIATAAGGAVGLLTSFAEIIEYIEGVASGAFISNFVLGHWFKSRIEKIGKESNNARSLKGILLNKYGEISKNSLEQWIKEDILKSA